MTFLVGRSVAKNRMRKIVDRLERTAGLEA